MLTEEKRKELRENIMVIEEQIRNLNKEKNACTQELVQDAIEQVKARFSNVAEGDKVKVRYTDGWCDKEMVEEFYLKGYHLAYYFNPTEMMGYVQVDFFKVKKDGSQSLRTQVINNQRIISIEKVTE